MPELPAISPEAGHAMLVSHYRQVFLRSGVEFPDRTAEEVAAQFRLVQVNGPGNAGCRQHGSKPEAPPQPVTIDLAGAGLRMGPVGTLYSAWRDTDSGWEGEAVYTDLTVAMDVVARDYVSEEYPDGEVPLPVTWTYFHGAWRLEDDTGDSMIRITPVTAYGPPS